MSRGLALLAAALLLDGQAIAGPKPAHSEIDVIAGSGDVSVAVAARGETLYGHAAGERRTPASVQKLLLSMALFDEFGPGHRIATRALSTKDRGAIGDLWVVGAGDPSMTSGDVGRLANRIGRAGIDRVRGSVVVDSSLFANDWRATGWQPWSRDFANRATALAIDGNGSANPPLAFGAALTDALGARGIAVSRNPRSGRVPPSAGTVAHVRSARLGDLVRHMNLTSSNFYAETLGKLLGARSLGLPGSMSKGAGALERFAAEHDVRVVAHDSSGLSYANEVSADGVVTLLEHAAGQPWGRTLRLSLPRPGEGTLASRLGGLAVHAKTGTLWNGSSALAGWVRLRTGGTAEFAVFSRHAGKSVEDAILERVASDLAAPRHRMGDCRRKWPVTDTGCHMQLWWEKIGPPARIPE